MATIKISPEFFINEIRNYSDWETAFWRELFQNSIDAGSSEINIHISKLNESCIVSFSDNGSGMSYETLENVFFNLGETTKKDENAIGGFGRARIILCFAQTDYLIHTNNLHVNGSGSFYEIQESTSVFKGCKFTITVPLKKLNSSITHFEAKLGKYLSMSQIPAKVNYKLSDSYSIKTFDNYLCKRGKSKTLSFGTAYSNFQGEFKNRIIFRVNGVMMFSKYTTSPSQFIVEIDPKKSRKVLLSNRDGVTWLYSDEVDEFCSTISKETLSAFKNSEFENTQVHGKKRKFISNCSQFDNKIENLSTNNLSMQFLASELNHDPPSIEDDDLGMVVITKTKNKKMKKIATEFENSIVNQDKSRKNKIFNKWIIACESALSAYCELTNTSEINWIPGLIFDESMEACHKMIDDCHGIMLNPVKNTQENLFKIKYNLNDFSSNIDMLTLACHEVTHCMHRYHDESFSNLFTDIVRKTMVKVKETNNLMNS